MKSRPVLCLGALLALVACSDDDDQSAPPTTPAPSATSAAATTEPAPATAPETTQEATTTVPEQVAAAELLVGNYQGQWENTTFGSVGSMQAEFTVDTDAQTATLTLDIGGTAFGSPDPAPLTTVIDLTASGPIAGSDTFFGDFTIEIDVDGHLLFVAAAVPEVGGREMVVDGTFSGDNFAGTYAITGLADGTFTCTRT